jgi:hypothetical protein
MPTEGIEAVFLTTHNWGKSARFFPAPGMRVVLRSTGSFQPVEDLLMATA